MSTVLRTVWPQQSGEREAGSDGAAERRRARPAIDTSQIESRCVRMALQLDWSTPDQVTMLRMARSLKTIHGHLQRGLRDYAREEGWTYDTAMLNGALANIEQDLRTVLLEYSSQQPRQMRDCLRHAVDEVLDALEILNRP